MCLMLRRWSAFLSPSFSFPRTSVYDSRARERLRQIEEQKALALQFQNQVNKKLGIRLWINSISKLKLIWKITWIRDQSYCNCKMLWWRSLIWFVYVLRLSSWSYSVYVRQVVFLIPLILKFFFSEITGTGTFSTWCSRTASSCTTWKGDPCHGHPRNRKERS